MIYLDTSVLGALFFHEPGAEQQLVRLEAARGEPLAVSAWTLAEMASVGAIKERTGQVDAAGRAAALAAFHRFVGDMLSLIEVEPDDFRTAAVLLDAPTLSLRAADALHLAVARRLRARLMTLDRRQTAAAQHYGLPLLP